MTSSQKFQFPHETLTPIIGKPTNTTLQLLQRQLFTNARSVPSARGGGVHGHLAMLLTDVDYLARAGVTFIVPVHPGPPPLPVGTAAVIAIALRTYTDAITDVTKYNNLSAALTSQILTAVNSSFLSALEDPDFLVLAMSHRSPCSLIFAPNTAHSPPKNSKRTVRLCLSLGTWTIPSRISGQKLPTFNAHLRLVACLMPISPSSPLPWR